jgi:hypothetical protein
LIPLTFPEVHTQIFVLRFKKNAPLIFFSNSQKIPSTVAYEYEKFNRQPNVQSMFSILKGWNLWHLLKTRTARAAMAAESAVFTADRAIITPSPSFRIQDLS